jgi:hypothetical protein
MGVRGRLDEVVLSVLSIGGGRERRSSAIFGTRRFSIRSFRFVRSFVRSGLLPELVVVWLIVFWKSI